MRRLVCGLLLAGVAAPAFAGDFDDSWLRGSTTDGPLPHPYVRWSGLYGGGQVSADFHNSSFSNDGNATFGQFRNSDTVLGAVSMGNLPALTSQTVTGTSFGGFAGYNFQIDDVVLGVEANFNQASANMNTTQTQTATSNQLARGSITVTGTSGPNTTFSTFFIPTSVSQSNTLTAKLLDEGSVRIRGAWAYENFLPYVMVGVSVARVDSIQTVFAHYVGTATTTTTTSGFPPVTGPPVPVDRTYLANPSTTGKYRFGFSAGLGLDYALTRNFFLRGEIEYLQLGVPSNLTMNTMSVGAGGGLKF